MEKAANIRVSIAVGLIVPSFYRVAADRVKHCSGLLRLDIR
jgi:hypothetical protein